MTTRTYRYTKAVDQLGRDKLDVCLGGIYALERIAVDSQPMDVQAALTVLGRLPQRAAVPRRGDLSHVHLEGAELRDAHLGGAELWGLHLEGASLRDAHLEEAQLSFAHLEGAFLENAHLEGRPWGPPIWRGMAIQHAPGGGVATSGAWANPRRS